MNILSLDRGSKRIGIAWMDSTNSTPLPLGFLWNTSMVYSDLSSLMMQYQIDMVLYGYPTGNRNVIAKIDNFIKNMKYCVSDTVVFQPIDEHYSSTQASDLTWDLGKKHISQDTVSAMILLERWSRKLKVES
jgi:RNase H-fold protein (predicted Holliday junction resolvase)